MDLKIALTQLNGRDNGQLFPTLPKNPVRDIIEPFF